MHAEYQQTSKLVLVVILVLRSKALPDNSIFLRLTWELAGKYALIGILCLFRRVRWYVGN